MKILLLSAITILSLLSTNAAALKNLSEKLSSSLGEIVDNTDGFPNEINDGFRENADDVISELDKLKTHNDAKSSRNKEVVNISELEDSLKKLHASHHREEGHRSNALETPHGKSSALEEETFADEQHHQSEQKEILENLPLPGTGDDVNEMSNEKEKSIKTGHHRLSTKNELAVNPVTMFRQLNGKLSAYDVAQYIFWTNDEAGVASAIEELIAEGIMSRENAIEFLNDIRLGIDYSSSAKQNEGGKNIHFGKQQQQQHQHQWQPRTTPTTTATRESGVADEIPFSYNYQKFRSLFKPTNKDKDIVSEEDEAPTLSPVALNALEKIPSLIKSTEAHRQSGSKSPPQEVDELGRSRLADFLVGEYSLEEAAKTMFTQSLAHGSEESQVALQKLTQFLEKEGKHGRISPTLQKKILDVLLAALSDTLTENPEVMERARLALTTK